MTNHNPLETPQKKKITNLVLTVKIDNQLLTQNYKLDSAEELQDQKNVIEFLLVSMSKSLVDSIYVKNAIEGKINE
jgi:hypothetical protein